VLKIEKDRNVRVDMLRAVEAALARGEAALTSPDHPVRDDAPSMKEGADAERRTRQEMRLEALQDVLVAALETVRRGLAEYAEERDQKRKSG
jgi:hypothetical protein